MDVLPTRSRPPSFACPCCGPRRTGRIQRTPPRPRRRRAMPGRPSSSSPSIPDRRSSPRDPRPHPRTSARRRRARASIPPTPPSTVRFPPSPTLPPGGGCTFAWDGESQRPRHSLLPGLLGIDVVVYPHHARGQRVHASGECAKSGVSVIPTIVFGLDADVRGIPPHLVTVPPSQQHVGKFGCGRRGAQSVGFHLTQKVLQCGTLAHPAVLRAGIIASAEVREPLCDMSPANAKILEQALAALGK